MGKLALGAPHRWGGLVLCERLTSLPRSAGRAAFSEPQGSLGKRCLHAFRRHGKFSETATGRVSEGVGQGGRSRWERTFTRSQRRIAPIHQNNLDAGDLRKCEYGI